ncbi:MAG: IS3 family transposase [Erysipelotrichaceae bacterium]|jgi:transposase InsO family protein|nr:IS3 family transposase [Erysipelotrichaceae bacterium]
MLPILDLYSQDIVSYTISDKQMLSVATEMLDKAFENIANDTQLIFHSNQGWQCQLKRCQEMLVKKGSDKYLHVFDSVEHFKAELIDYLDYYNNRRFKAKRKGLPPALHRQQTLSVT